MAWATVARSRCGLTHAMVLSCWHGSEAIRVDLFRDHLFHAPDVSHLLEFQFAPHLLKPRLPIRVGNVLVIAPQGIEPLAQVVNKVVVVILATGGFTDVF